MKKIAYLFVPLLAVSACSSDSRTHSEFQTPSNIGYLGPTLTSAVRGSDVSTSGDGYAYAVGVGSNSDFYGYAGIVPTTTVSVPPTAGSATWSGTYKLAQITGIELPAGGLQGYTVEKTGAISLTADFTAGTLIGSGAGLTVNGTFSGSDLSGDASYGGLNGALTGKVGTTGAVGAFHGNSGTDIYAGGFMVGAP